MGTIAAHPVPASPAPTRPRAGRGRGRRRGRIASTLRSSRCTESARRSPGGSAKLGLATVGDVLWQRPRRYEEPAPTKRICDLFGDEEAVIEVVVRSASSRRRGRLKILTARVADETGEIRATWFNQPWLEAKLVRRHVAPHPRTRQPARLRRLLVRPRRRRRDRRLRARLSGDARTSRRRSSATSTPRRSSSSATSETTCPRRCSRRERLPLRADALAAVHRPRSLAEAEVGRTRLAFDELLVLRLALAAGRPPHARAHLRSRSARPGELMARYRAVAPVHAHRRPGAGDGARSTRISTATIPMQRLLQGDVGSGKTVVALHALLRAVEARRQGALMAPTETLAEQHFLTIDELCAPLGVRVTLLTSSLRAKEHAAARQLIASGDAQIVVGHARAHREGGRLLATSRSPSSTSSTASASRSGPRSSRGGARTSST